MGSQAVLVDPTGTTFGAWQPGTFPGFTVLGEVGTPDWFELHTRDHAAAVAFYRDVFGWDTVEIPNNDRFRYTMMRDPRGEGELAGIFDASSSLPEGAPPHWSVYWRVDDADAVAARAKSLGGTVVTGPSGSRYGRTATLTDPAGAYFRLRALNA
jgi:predicted enzyme related to lactoylglutathione lyase